MQPQPQRQQVNPIAVRSCGPCGFITAGCEAGGQPQLVSPADWSDWDVPPAVEIASWGNPSATSTSAWKCDALLHNLHLVRSVKQISSDTSGAHNCGPSCVSV